MIKNVDGKNTLVAHGKLTKEIFNVFLELQVLESARGFYLGTADDGGPVSRESLEYWRTFEEADNALVSKGDFQELWTQKHEA
jgi:hypothetical protein